MFLFEIHLTIKLPIENLPKFTNFCTSKDYKPILIELARGSHQVQPMLTKICKSQTLQEALSMSHHISQELALEKFEVCRTKIEIPANQAILFHEKPTTSVYYEWHGKVNYKSPEVLEHICTQHHAHLSINSLKNESDRRFITIREYTHYSLFLERVEDLKINLKAHNFLCSKEQFEYCVHDSHIILDTGWL